MMTKITQSFLLLFMVFGFCGSVKSQSQKNLVYFTNNKSEHFNNPTPSLTWFKKAKFGMFIHWGLYSKIAGEWDGKWYYGESEWIMKRAEIPVKEYGQVAATFNPVNFNAEELVKMAKDAGMKYIIITAKHHDGFAMFHSQASDYNIVDATPFKRDPLKELARACHKYRIKLGFYYSQSQDWHEPNAEGNNWDFDPQSRDSDVYFKNKVQPQVKELLKNYGPISIMWFDTPKHMTKKESSKLTNMVHKYQPNCLVSSRVGNGVGDYLDLKDHQLPKKTIKRPFEALFTHNDSWGYTKFDKNFKSPRDIIKLLTETNSKGGNLLLNIGPKGDGFIPRESINMLTHVGKWMNRNQKAIYGSTYCPFPDLTWGYCTLKPGSYYFHVFAWPKNGYLRIPDVAGYVEQVELLASSTPLDYKKDGSDLLVDVPQKMPDPLDTVIKVQYKGKVKLSPIRTLMPHYITNLSPVEATFDGAASRRLIRWRIKTWKDAPIVDKWHMSMDKAEWSFRVTRPNTYRLVLRYSYRNAKQPVDGIIRFEDQQLYFQAHQTGVEPWQFEDQQIGIIHMDKLGIKKLIINPLSRDLEDEFILLQQVKLIPFKKM